MKPGTVRTSIDLPRDLHRRLRGAAARQGCSARQLILASIEHAIEQTEPARPHRRLSLDPPLVRSSGRKPFDLTNEQIYDLIDLDRVQEGEEIVITRHGKPVARLVPDAGGIDRSKAQAAAERIRARARTLRAGKFNWDALKADRDAGRP